jgi:hypothetical protein
MVIKRSRQDSSADLVAAIDTLVPLLRDQKEHDAADALLDAAKVLRGSKAEAPEAKEAVATIIDAFEGDHELIAYTYQREGAGGQWTEVEQLAHASARVLSLARRMQ